MKVNKLMMGTCKVKEVERLFPESDVTRKEKKLKIGIETCRVEEYDKDQREEADDAKLQAEETQAVVNRNDVKRKKKRHKNKVESGLETCRVEECNNDQREEANDVNLQGEEVQEMVNHNDVKRKKHNHKTGTETCIVEECNKGQREEACHAKLQSEEVQNVGNNNDVKRKKKRHKQKVESGKSKLRTWIEEQHEKIAESEKEAKGKVNAARDMVKHLKQKLQDEAAKLIMTKNGALLSISEHETLSRLNTETDQAHAQLLEAKGAMAAKKQRCDALRTEPHCVDVDGRGFWKLKGYNNSRDIVLQDTGSWDANVSKEEWFVFDVESKEAIEKYSSSRRI